MHYPKIDIDRLYLPRTSGGRGLAQVVTAYRTKTIGLEKIKKEEVVLNPKRSRKL